MLDAHFGICSWHLLVNRAKSATQKVVMEGALGLAFARLLRVFGLNHIGGCGKVQ